MEPNAQKLFPYIEDMAERQVRGLLAMAITRKDFDVIDALEEELERCGVIMER